VVDLAKMKRFPVDKGTCALCGQEVAPKHVRWISGSVFCPKCIRDFKRGELIKPSENPRAFLLTEKGEERFPGLKVVGYCAFDSMKIYQRWVSAGIAQVGEKPMCPSCLGKTAEMLQCKM
jgi:hypothetical protein